MNQKFDPEENSDDESKDGKIVSIINSTIMIDQKQGIIDDYTKLQGTEILKDTPKRPTPIQVPIVSTAKSNRLLSKSKFLCYIVM